MDDSSKMMKMTYKAQQKINHILTADQVYELFQFLDFHLRDEGCDHTRRFTQEWLNCYEDYDL